MEERTLIITNISTQVDRDTGKHEHRIAFGQHNGYNILGDVFVADGCFYLSYKDDGTNPINDVRTLPKQAMYLRKALEKLEKDNIRVKNGFSFEAYYSAGYQKINEKIIEKRQLTFSELYKTTKNLARRVIDEDEKYFLKLAERQKKKVSKNWLV